MAIAYKGKKIVDLFYKGKKINSLYYKGKKIYSSILPTGFVLWTGQKGFISNYSDIEGFTGVTSKSDTLLVNQTVTLNQPITKLKQGITINIDPQGLSMWYTSSTYKSTWKREDVPGYYFEVTINANTVSLADLQSRKGVKIATGTFTNLYVKAIDDTHLQFYNADGNFNFNNSTLIGWNDSSSSTFERLFLVIDSITAI